MHTVTIVLDRVRPIIRASCYELNILESIALGCYLQGAIDVVKLVPGAPERLAQLAHPEVPDA